MKILIFNWRDRKHTWSGGGEIYILEQATRWVKAGHQVSLFCGQDIRTKLPEYEQIDGIHIYRKGGRYSLYLWAVWYYFTRFYEKTDIIVEVENGIPFFSLLYARIPKICYVYHVHGDQFFYELSFPLSFIGFLIERYLFPLLYKNIPIIAISKTTQQQLVNIGFPKKNISIIYSGLNKTHKNMSVSNRKYAKPTILYLGRIKKYKRVDLLVKILEKISVKIPNARLIIAGWGTEASHLADLVMNSPLRKRINLLGPVSNREKKTLLQKSWVFVNPSIGEGWSIAVIEANHYGTPAVSLNVSGLAESIQSEITGLLAQNEDHLVSSIIRILRDKNLRMRLGANAMEWAKQFNWEKSANKSLRILKRIERGK